MTQRPLSLTLVGAGRMGGALLKRWTGTPGLLENSATVVIEPSPAPDVRSLAASHGLEIRGEPGAAIDCDIIVLAVKPQTMDAAASAVGRAVRGSPAYVSIAAGATLAGLGAALPEGAAIIRAMPNTPAQIGEGATALVANAHATAGQRAAAERLMAAAGMAVWLDDEAQMDAVTAVSGSGPAYVFLMAECLEEAARGAGLAPDLARALARQTVIGAARLMQDSPDDAAILRQNVTSPGGTTEAALAVLMDKRALARLLTAAVEAARGRAGALAR